MSTPTITAHGSVAMPTSLVPGGGTWGGSVDAVCFSPADDAMYATTFYTNPGVFSILSKISRTTNIRVWDVVMGGNADQITHVIASLDGTHVYVAKRNGSSAWIEKRLASDGSLVTSSATSANLAGAWNPGHMRIKNIGGVEYVALGGNTAGLFVVRTDTMAVVLDIADITGGITPWFMQRLSFDNGGNLWAGGYGGASVYSDFDTLSITNIAVSGGTITLTMSGNFTKSPSGRVIISGVTTSTYLNGQNYSGSATAGMNTFVITGTGLPDDPSHADTGKIGLYPGNDLIKIAVPSGTITPYITAVWPEDTDPNAPTADSAIFQVFDATDNTLIIGDENRPFRKINLAVNPPVQSQVMESDSPQNLYQAQFTGLYNSATQEGFGASGTELMAITCEGNFVTFASYSFFLKHTDLLADAVVFGQNGNGGQAIAGPLFNPAGYWTADATATDILDIICDNTSTNPHSGGLTLWTLQPSGTATRWEWFDVSITSGPNCALSGNFQHPNGTPVANGKLYLRLSQDAQVSGGAGAVSGGAALVITLDANGNVPSGTLIYSNDNLSPSSTFYRCSVVAPGGALVWGLEKVTITGAAYNLTAFVPPLPQDAGQP